MQHDVLVILAKHDVARDAVAAAWESTGGTVLASTASGSGHP
jgi:hypothetical protein